MKKTYDGIKTGFGCKVDEGMHRGPFGSFLVAYYECESIQEAVETALELLNTNYEVTIFSGGLYSPRSYHSRNELMWDFREYIPLEISGTWKQELAEAADFYKRHAEW